MKKLLITGFEPFGGESINSSWEAVLRLPEIIGEYELTKLRIPVSFSKSARTVINEANKIAADAVLCIGQAGGRDAVTPELVGINLRYATIPDNDGFKPEDEPIVVGGANAYFATLPMRKIVDKLNASNIPARLSYSAGAYVCNDVLYSLLGFFDGSDTRVGFIHVPYCAEQGKAPSMKLDEIVRALSIAVEAMDK